MNPNERSRRPAISARFQFSQSGLTDFDACRRLFYLRWVERLEWPISAIQSGDALSLGQRFHRLMRQHFVGLGADRALAAEPAGSPLHDWWQAFLRYGPDLPEELRCAELTLSAPLGEHRVVAKFDLLAVAPGRRAVIAEWKTGARFLDAHYRDSWQTCIYPYILAEAGAPYWAGAPPPAEKIEMLYWFSDFPASPLHLSYNAAAHAANARRLREAIAAIAGLPAEAFVPCDDERACGRCPYQTYCARGSAAGDRPEEADLEPETWDWSDTVEFEY